MKNARVTNWFSAAKRLGLSLDMLFSENKIHDLFFALILSYTLI
jgi:hypothetical protein